MRTDDLNIGDLVEFDRESYNWQRRP